MAKASIEKVNGRLCIVADGEVLPPMMMTVRTSTKTDVLLDPAYFRALGKAGIRVFFLILDTEWLKPGAFDLFRREAETLLREVPDAYLCLRVGLHPPVSWCREHPEETVGYSDGKARPVHLYTESYEADYPAMYSLCSERWRRDAGAALSELYDRVAALPYADRILGFFFAAGGTSEWYYLSPMEYTAKTKYTDSGGWVQTEDTQDCDVYADTSEAFRRNFARYLTRRYGTDRALSVAWGRESSLTSPELPGIAERYFVDGADYDLLHPLVKYATSDAPEGPSDAYTIGVFSRLNRSRRAMDFYQALAQGTAESVIYFGRIIKEKNPGLLTGAFCGSLGCCKYFTFGTAGATLPILDSGVIDFLASPGVYENREPGGFTGGRQVYDSFRLRGRMFITEEDCRTHLENAYYRDGFALYDMADTAAVMTREFGKNYCQNLGAWWFDQHVGGGRYRDPDILSLMGKLQTLGRELTLAQDIADFTPEVAFIYDEASLHAVSEETSHQAVEFLKNYVIDRPGFPHAEHFVADMSEAAMPDYKLYVFVNCYVMDNKTRQNIKKKLSANQATALFLWGQGFGNPDAPAGECLDPRHMSDLMGISVSLLPGTRYARYRISEPADPVFRGFDPAELLGDYTGRMEPNCSHTKGPRPDHVILCPVLVAAEEGEVLGRFAADGTPALTRRRGEDYDVLYLASRHVEARLLHNIAREAGVHTFTESGDTFYAGGGLLTLHAAASGEKHLSFPYPVRVEDALSGEVLTEKGMSLSFSLRRGQTRLLRVSRR